MLSGLGNSAVAAVRVVVHLIALTVQHIQQVSVTPAVQVPRVPHLPSLNRPNMNLVNNATHTPKNRGEVEARSIIKGTVPHLQVMTTTQVLTNVLANNQRYYMFNVF